MAVTAYAREAEAKKGMDESQITGTASSYARKYALNGLFLIDDTKDADATNDHGKAKKPDPLAAAKGRLWAAVKSYAAEHGADPKAVIQGVEKRPDAKMGDPAWLASVAAEFEGCLLYTSRESAAGHFEGCVAGRFIERALRFGGAYRGGGGENAAFCGAHACEACVPKRAGHDGVRDSRRGTGE